MTDDERRLLEALFAASSRLSSEKIDSLKVETLDDGGMGSLRLIPEGPLAEDRSFGSAVTECRFTDSDGVEVLAALYLDREDRPFEMNIWKTNFAPLVQIPNTLRAQSTGSPGGKELPDRLEHEKTDD